MATPSPVMYSSMPRAWQWAKQLVQPSSSRLYVGKSDRTGSWERRATNLWLHEASAGNTRSLLLRVSAHHQVGQTFQSMLDTGNCLSQHSCCVISRKALPDMTDDPDFRELLLWLDGLVSTSIGRFYFMIIHHQTCEAYSNA
jgi:hypothetical protein